MQSCPSRRIGTLTFCPPPAMADGVDLALLALPRGRDLQPPDRLPCRSGAHVRIRPGEDRQHPPSAEQKKSTKAAPPTVPVLSAAHSRAQVLRAASPELVPRGTLGSSAHRPVLLGVSVFSLWLESAGHSTVDQARAEQPSALYTRTLPYRTGSDPADPLFPSAERHVSVHFDLSSPIGALAGARYPARSRGERRPLRPAPIRARTRGLASGERLASNHARAAHV